MMTALEDWRQRGKLSVWRYAPMLRMYAGWHFTADDEGCASILELIDAASPFTFPTHRTMTVTGPTCVAADRIFGAHTLRVVHPSKLRLEITPSPEGAPSLNETADRLTLSLCPESLGDFRQAIKDLQAGVADFSVAFGDHRKDQMARMSFWWWPKRRSANDR